ncbi:MAG TPA: bifunctional chorismate mutase/prephenate dehydrogenase [Phycisphaerales bacterium]|nr:bifunctional chorismate mutase/prephenate dehydrogenase [Phycisphaerales bacterium]
MDNSKDNTPDSGVGIPPELLALRNRLDDIDHAFLELLSERNRTVAEVAAVKRSTGVPIRDTNRETRLLDDRRSRASASGLDPEVIESLFRLVLWASRNKQARLLAAVPPDLPTCRVAVIGAKGGMGRLLVDLFTQFGHEVLQVDRDTKLTIADAAASAEVTVLSVNIDQTPAVAAIAGPHVPDEGLLTDVTSTKRLPVEAMMHACQASVIGSHPLFGPSVHSLQGQRIALTPGRLVEGTDWMNWLRRMYQAAGMILLETTPEDHDRVMAVVQVLTHYSTEVLGRTMQKLGVSIEETMEFTSPIYHLELLMTARHFAQAPGLYGAIEMSNPNTPAVVETFRQAAEEFDILLKQGDQAAFDRTFAEVTDFFGSFAQKALRESTHLIDRMVERS